MKKITLFAATVALLCCFSSCTKEGVYSPKKKISAVYYSASEKVSYLSPETQEWITEVDYSITKRLQEKWNWDGKTLQSIVYYEPMYDENDNVTTVPVDTVKFKYDGNQLTEITGDGNSRYEFVYDGRKLKEINMYSRGRLANTMIVTHDGNKITKLIFPNANGYDKKSPKEMRCDLTLFRLLVTDMDVADNIFKSLSKASKSKGANEETVLEFKYDGNNVSEYTISISGVMAIKSMYEYDNKNNPYCDFFGYIFLDGGEESLAGPFCENNVTKVTTTYYGDNYKDNADERTFSYEYRYTYDGKWPLTKTQSINGEEDDYRYDYSNTLHFEY